MKTMFLSRKNLVVLAIAALFAFNFIVIAVLLLNVAFLNDILYFDLGLPIIGYDYVVAGDQAGVVITGIFLFLLVFGIVFIYRLKRLNGNKFFSKKVLIPNLIYFLIWIVVFAFINLLVEFFDFGYFASLLFTELTVLVLTIGTGIIIAIPLGAIIVLIVNFVNMGRPYGFFAKELMPDFGDENEETNVSGSFGEVEKKEEKPAPKETKVEEPAPKEPEVKDEEPKTEEPAAVEEKPEEKVEEAEPSKPVAEEKEESSLAEDKPEEPEVSEPASEEQKEVKDE